MASTVLVITGLLAAFIACIGDFILLSYLGVKRPNYSHIEDTMSELGTKESPYRLMLLIWWIVFGLLLVYFGFVFGFIDRFQTGTKLAIAIMIGIFGIGAGIISGIYPEDPKDAPESLSGKLHGIGGGLGYMALITIPAITLGYPAIVNSLPLLIGSIIALISEVIFFILFILSDNNTINKTGLWERLFLGFCYLYLLSAIGGQMIAAL
jgi:hypothetical protein